MVQLLGIFMDCFSVWGGGGGIKKTILTYFQKNHQPRFHIFFYIFLKKLLTNIQKNTRERKGVIF